MPTIICGHSLGAARAYLYAFSRIKRGLPVDGVYCLASPRPGDKVIGETFSANMLVRSIKNGADIVPDVPPSIPFIQEYSQPRPFESIYEPPAAGDDDPLSRWHHIQLYVAGCHKLPLVSGVHDNPAVTLANAADQIQMLYNTDQGWDWINPVSGSYWAMRIMPNGAKVMIARGSITATDWVDDFDAVQETVLGARVSSGFWSGIGSIENELDKALA
jgi:hypothetical protein